MSHFVCLRLSEPDCQFIRLKRPLFVTLSVRQCVLPSVTQDGGVVKRPPPVAVHQVDVSAVLQEELAGCQGILVEETGSELLFRYVFLFFTYTLSKQVAQIAKSCPEGLSPR